MSSGTVKIWGYKLSRKNKPVKKKPRKSSGSGFSTGDVLPKVTASVIVLSLAVFAVFSLRHYFLNSPTFDVKYIAVNKSSPASFQGGEQALDKRYLGRNIFSVVPSQVELLLRKDYPNLKMIRVRRIFPDTVEVDLVPRESFACIESAGGIVLDRGGMVLSSGEIPPGLVRVKGVNFFLSRPQPGIVIGDKNVVTALGLIDTLLNSGKILRGDLESLDVSDQNNIWVTAKGVPVNFGNDDFERKTVTLRDILSDPKIDLGGVRYIDLRFKDPVYAYKRK